MFICILIVSKPFTILLTLHQPRMNDLLSDWIKYFGYLNSLYARATRAIINYATIEEYCLRFFPRENFSCLCRLYPIKT